MIIGLDTNEVSEGFLRRRRYRLFIVVSTSISFLEVLLRLILVDALLLGI